MKIATKRLLQKPCKSPRSAKLKDAIHPDSRGDGLWGSLSFDGDSAAMLNAGYDLAELGAEERFRAMLAGLPEGMIEELRDAAIFAGATTAAAQLDGPHQRLQGSRAGEHLRRIMRRLGKEGELRLAVAGFDPKDFLRAVVTLLYSAPRATPFETDLIVTACLRFGQMVAVTTLQRATASLHGDAVGEALLQALDFTTDTMGNSAKRARVSVSAISQNVTRIRGKLQRRH